MGVPMNDPLTGFAARFPGATGDSNSDGALDAGNFVSSTSPTASDADDFFLFNTSTNTLSYDADGSGGGSAVVIATFNTAITEADIIFF